MTDITTKLRNGRHCDEVMEAADEIDRLRAEVAMWRDAHAEIDKHRGGLLSLVHAVRRIVVDPAVHVDDIQLVELIAAQKTDAARWRFFMTEPDGFDVSVREYDDDGDEMWISCYPAAELQDAIDKASAALTEGK